MKNYTLTVMSNEQVSQRYWLMRLDSSEIKEKIKPGQFFNIRSALEAPFYPLLRRPFSIFRIHETVLEFLYKVDGEGTQSLAKYKIGDSIEILGPLGYPFTIRERDKNILILGRGVGTATLTALAQSAYNQGVKTHAILSGRTKDDLSAVDILYDYCDAIYPVTEEEKNSSVEQVNQLMQELIETHHIDAVYTCGSKRLTHLSQDVIRDKGIYGEVALEEYMACGVGVCYSCVCKLQKSDGVHLVKSCEDGPVFSLEEVIFND